VAVADFAVTHDESPPITIDFCYLLDPVERRVPLPGQRESPETSSPHQAAVPVDRSNRNEMIHTSA
jgi:hypothetical protein